MLAQDARSASATATGQDEAFSPGVTSSVAGVVERIDAPRLYLRSVEGSLTVEFLEDAVFQRDHPVGLDGFIPGDEVVVEGEWSDGIYVGKALTPMLYMLEGLIIDVARDRIQTVAGVVLLTADTRYVVADTLIEKPPPYVADGKLIRALGRRQQNGDLVGLMICQDAV